MRFVYLGPPDEPEVMETFAFGLDWVKGQPVDIGDLDVAAALRRHPHFAAEGDDARDIGAAVRVAPSVEPDEDAPGFDPAEAWAAQINGDEPPVAPKRRGRPPKVSH